MKLTLEEIWKLADFLEEQQHLDTSENSIMSDINEAPAETQERVLRMPSLHITEDWGKGEGGNKPPDRTQLEQIVATATKGANTPFDKFRAIQNQMTKIAGGEAVKNPRRILSQILLLDTLNRLFKSFQPAPAGFLNEAFLSVFYGSFQKPAGEANIAKEIGDITDNGIPVSIKTLGKASAKVKGSTVNLITSINNSPEKKVYFDVYSKVGGKEVGSLIIERFVVDSSNINQFLNLPTGTIPLDTNGNLQIPEKTPEQTKSLQEQDVFTDTDMSKESEDYFSSQLPLKKNWDTDDKKAGLAFETLKRNKYTLPRAGKFREFFNNLNDGTLQKLQNILSVQPKNNEILALSKEIAGEEITKRIPSKLKSEFEIYPQHWSKFARQYGQEKITINFSDKDINNILENAVKSLDNSITEIFNNLTDFTKYLQSYLTSTNESRANDGIQAMKIAQTLPERTKSVVSKTSEQEKD